MMDKDIIVSRLDLISAKARVLANDLKKNKLWEGELSLGLREISSHINSALIEAKDDEGKI